MRSWGTHRAGQTLQRWVAATGGREIGDAGGGHSAGDIAGDTHLYGRRCWDLALCSHLLKVCWSWCFTHSLSYGAVGPGQHGVFIQAAVVWVCYSWDHIWIQFLNNPVQKQDGGNNLIVSEELSKVSFLIIQSLKVQRNTSDFILYWCWTKPLTFFKGSTDIFN